MDNTQSHFDVYTLVDKTNADAGLYDYLLYAKAPYAWTLRELTDLTRVGIGELYVDEQHRGNYDRYVRIHEPLPEVAPALAPRFRINRIQDIGSHLIESCFLAEISAPMVEKLGVVANGLVECLLEDPRAILQVQNLAEYDLYTYVHSVGVGTLTTAIALTMGERNASRLREYALGGLFHDVGKKDVPLTVLNKAGPLSPDEWEQMKSHPDKGFELIKQFDVSQTVLDIIGLHHEKLDGSGYPHGLAKDQIPIHVQIATVADIFNALTTARCYHRKRTRFEALMFMKHHLRGKISPDVFKALVACLVTEKPTA